MKVKTNRTKAQIARAMEVEERDRLVKVEARERARVESLALGDRMNETERLAEGRGEEVQRLPSGALQVITRDVLLAMVRRQRITAEQFDAAVTCRDLYESRSAGLSAMEYSDTTSGGGDREKQIAKAIQRAKKLHRIGAVEAAVNVGAYRTLDGTQVRIDAFAQFAAPGAPPIHVALQMLRAVVGQGIAISTFGEGRAVERNMAALRVALDIAAEVLDGKD